MQKVLFRSDSSSLIGLGHIKRDLVYASAFDDVNFACLELEGNIAHEIPYKVYFLGSNKLGELVNLINKHKFTHVIIDNYAIDYEFEKALKQATNVQITSFDDELKPHFCDRLINPNLYATKEDYANLVPKTCEILAGFKLVRDEFYKEAKIKRSKIYDYFICLGGSDVKNLTANLINSLPQNSKIAVATTSANANLSMLKSLENANLSLFVDSPNLAKLMNESKKLLISASSLVNEAMVLNAEFVAYKVAPNQQKIYEYLQANGFECYDLD